MNFDAVTGPVLVVSGELDRVVVPAIGRATAKKYANATYVVIPGSDHMVLSGAALPTTMGHIDRWMEANKTAVRETSAEAFDLVVLPEKSA
ncbi:alpha/beta hydrolase [Hoyosella altamirensis]|uniref:alpha/beta hydrolase n=1 Tax=Hoyosella altamirensis TaxID=616997 RepID=UPI001E466FFA|nr:alpha/beta hydrolase [Hoyosella altamirensis]